MSTCRETVDISIARFYRLGLFLPILRGEHLWHIQFHDAIALLSLFKNGSTLEIISANFRRKTNLSHVFSAISPSRWPKTSKRMERCPTVATSAATQTSGLLGWNNTCWFTVDCHQSLFDSYLKNFTAKLDWLVHSGENLSFAYSATTPSHKFVTSRHTCQPIQGKALQMHKL